MPALLITTNASYTDANLKELLPKLSKSVGEALNKPEGYMCIGVNKANMIFGGSDEPCAYATLNSIGSITPSSNAKVSAILCDLLQKHLKVSPARIYIQFTDSSPANFGHNNTTFQQIWSQ